MKKSEILCLQDDISSVRAWPSGTQQVFLHWVHDSKLHSNYEFSSVCTWQSGINIIGLLFFLSPKYPIFVKFDVFSDKCRTSWIKKYWSFKISQQLKYKTSWSTNQPYIFHYYILSNQESIPSCKTSHPSQKFCKKFSLYSLQKRTVWVCPNSEQLHKIKMWVPKSNLFLLELNHILTASVISQSVHPYMCFLVLSHQYWHNFLSKPQTSLLSLH